MAYQTTQSRILVFLCCLFIAPGSQAWILSSGSSSLPRRIWLQETLALVISAGAGTSTGIIAAPLASEASAVADSNPDELPLVLRDFTKLAPLGKGRNPSLEGKTLNLSLSELASRLEKDLAHGHTGQGGYFISGDLDESLFQEDCVFVDPTNRVDSLTQYRNALKILFDPKESQVELVQPIQINPDERILQASIRSRGVLKLPWRPYITTYESNIIYTIDDSGLIKEQAQTWSKAASKALQESFTPGLNRPAPQSPLRPSSSERVSVTKLFDHVNGRRPYEYSQAERDEISQLVNQIVQEEKQTINKSSFRPDLLPGKWMLVYIQPGPSGVGIDRRIPFPDFDFNDNFQIFSQDSVVNIGQVLGPLVQVQVQGSLVEQTPGSLEVPKRFIAQINGGEICQNTSCLNLPISGEGLFDSVYLGDRLRIGQNINGGGARVVQVKLE